MSIACKNIINEIEKKFPLYLAEDFDNCGLIIGDFEKTVKRVLLCLEVNLDVVKEAVEKNVDMIISHHPIIFKPIKRIIKNNYISKSIYELIKNDINLYVLHTNFDNAIGGMNYIIANILELYEIKPLSYNKSQELYKLTVYVPNSHVEQVREALFKAGCGHIGNYSCCSFNIKGEGTFMPLEGTNPYVGKVNELEKVEEIKIETIVRSDDIKKAIEYMQKAHPYEEVAYDIYKLENKINEGTGTFGELKDDMTFGQFCQYVKEKLNIPYLNAAGDFNRKVKRVAVVGGAGAEFYKDAINRKCDVLLTGDIKHHQAIDAINEGINLIDGGHYFTEVVAIPYIANYLSSLFEVECIVSNINTNPFYKV